MIIAAVLVFLMPLLSGLVVALLGARLGARCAGIEILSILAAFAGAIWILISVASSGPIRLTVAQGAATPWFLLELYIDRLSAVMLVLITAVSLVVHVYSMRYMQGEPGYARFYALLGVMSAVLLAMVASANLFLLFACWYLVSWLLYLLLAYDHRSAPAVKCAGKTWVVLRLGDAALLAGVVLAYHAYGTLEFPALFERAAQQEARLSLWRSGPEVSAATAVTLLLFIGAMAKSAQLPLHVWLPDTMDTPTPVSALMHAGIVNAGGFLINRLAPLYGLAPDTLHVVFAVGGLTMIAGAAVMLMQSDVKRMLGFSTVGQMGYMIMECGLGAFALAIFHLIAHGIFKATSFLAAGNVIHEARRDPKFPHDRDEEEEEPSHLPWLTGVLVTLLLPLIILLAGHGLLRIPLLDDQGTVVFLFFAWVTSSQAILSLYRLKPVGSWTVAGLMVLTLSFVIITYLWAVGAFTVFLYPAPGEAARYFQAAAFPRWLFDLFVLVVTLLVLVGWAVVYTNIRGQRVLLTRWMTRLVPPLYVWVWNRLYVDALYARVWRWLLRAARRLDARLMHWWL